MCKNYSLARQSCQTFYHWITYILLICICYFGVTNLWLWIKISKIFKAVQSSAKLYTGVWKIQVIIMISKPSSGSYIHVHAYIFSKEDSMKFHWMQIFLYGNSAYTMFVLGRGLLLSFWTCVQSFWFMSIKYVQFNSPYLYKKQIMLEITRCGLRRGSTNPATHS